MTGAFAAILLLLSAAPAAMPEEVTVRVLGRHHPQLLRLSRPGESHVASVEGGRLLLDGRPVEGTRVFPASLWRLSVRGAPPREYQGSVSLAVDRDELAIGVRMAIEDHVASVVAAETEGGTPMEALKALAVVARSYAASARGRHADADLCDLAHCQVLGTEAPGAHRASARAAARATRGEVLRLPDGAIAAAPFHAACGGHTADPREVFGGEGTGAAAVPDPTCPAAPWRTTVPARLFARVASRELAAAGSSREVPVASELRFQRGQGGVVVRVTDGEASVGGEAFTRALDRALGHGKVRSARFGISGGGEDLLLSGSGIGHGVGLCQAGSIRRAGAGEGYERILRHYFPGARLAAPSPIAGRLLAEPTAPPSAPLSRTSSR